MPRKAVKQESTKKTTNTSEGKRSQKNKAGRDSLEISQTIQTVNVELTSQTREHVEQMGTTGAGIEKAADIEGETALSKTWEAVQQVSPWFFEMRDLIGQRPNLVPTGLGNSHTLIDSSLLLGGTNDFIGESPMENDAKVDTIGVPSIAVTGSEHGSSSSDDASLPETPSQLRVTTKRKQPGRVDEQGVKREAGPSAPDSHAKKKVKGSVADKFTAAAVAEEGTAQRQLELKMVKAKAVRDVKVQKLKSQAEVRVASMKFKQEMAREKARQEHEFRMAQIGGVGANLARHGAGLTFPTPSTSGMDGGSGHGGFQTLTSSEHLSGHSTPAPYSFATELNDPSLSFRDYSSTA
ncbi:hypothetical protein JOM56_014121 [Amanita muscaria]